MTVALLAGMYGPCASADVVKLKGGGEIRGKLQRSQYDVGDQHVTIKTLNGAIVVIDRDDIDSLGLRPQLIETYLTRARATPDTVDAQWELAEWCRVNRLSSQRKDHLERVIELDPNHSQAHTALGHSLHDGVWLSRDEIMRNKGFVRHKGRYVTLQQLDLIQQKEAEQELERQWSKKVKLWYNWLTGSDAERRRNALAELNAISDPAAVEPLVRFFGGDANTQVRELLLDILARIPGKAPVRPLVNFSLYDGVSKLRSRAIDAISSDQRVFAVPMYLKELHSANNDTIRRAAIALEELGNESIVPELIEALVTTHHYRIRVPDNSGLTFRSDGSFTTGTPGTPLPPQIEGMLLTGQLPDGVIVIDPTANMKTKVVTVVRDQENREVLSALMELTKQSFGYDKKRWRLWWAQYKSGAAAIQAPP